MKNGESRPTNKPTKGRNSKLWNMKPFCSSSSSSRSYFRFLCVAITRAHPFCVAVEAIDTAPDVCVGAGLYFSRFAAVCDYAVSRVSDIVFSVERTFFFFHPTTTVLRDEQ